MICLHARQERDRHIAGTLDKKARRELRQARIASTPPTSAWGTGRHNEAGAGRWVRATTTAVVDMSWLMYLERVTRIELALSAWESERLPGSAPLTWEADCPLMTGSIRPLVTFGC
jgi:hypothetical protein